MCSVPQESVLGPRLFIVDLADRRSPGATSEHTSYADDTQLYLHCCLHCCHSRQHSCCSHWVAANRLKLMHRRLNYCWLGRASVKLFYAAKVVGTVWQRNLSACPCSNFSPDLCLC